MLVTIYHSPMVLVGFALPVSSLRKYLRGLSPSAIDLELSMMEIVEDEGDVQEEDLVEVELLLQFLTVETAAKRDFEFLQAILHRVLAVSETDSVSSLMTVCFFADDVMLSFTILHTNENCPSEFLISHIV